MAAPSVSDIRLIVGFRTHPKREKLRRRLGADGVLALVDLWLWAGGSRPDGSLDGMTDEDIEIAAGWMGAPGALVAALRDVGFLDGYQLHDWQDHQGWASGAARRSEAARRNVELRWERERQRQAGQGGGAAPEPPKKVSNTAVPKTITAVPPTLYGGNTPSPLPIPSPIPSPIQKEALPPRAPARDPAPSGASPRASPPPPQDAPPPGWNVEVLRIAWNAAKLGVGINADGWHEADELAGKIRDTAAARGESPEELAEKLLRAWPEMHADWAKRNRAPRGKGPGKLNAHFGAVVLWLDGGGRDTPQPMAPTRGPAPVSSHFTHGKELT